MISLTKKERRLWRNGGKNMNEEQKIKLEELKTQMQEKDRHLNEKCCHRIILEEGKDE